MKRRAFIKSCAKSVALLAASPLMSRVSAAVPSGPSLRDAVRVIPLKGAPYERGLQHGQTAKDSIHSVLASWNVMLQEQAGTDLEAFADVFSKATQFDQAIKEHTPDLWMELQGISDGSETPFKKIYAYNLTDESQWFLRYRGMGLQLPEGKGCSSIAFIDESTGMPVIAQNMDIPSGTEGYEILLQITDKDKELQQYVFTLAGMVGIIGLNSASMGVCNNSLPMLNQRKDGLPVNFLVRGLLDRKNFEEAKAFLHSVPHASGQNYVIGDSSAIGMFECSAAGVAQVGFENGSRQLIHTNHPLASNDINSNPAFAKPASTSDTYERLRSLKEHAAKKNQQYSFGFLKDILSASDDPKNPVCRHHSSADPALNFTAASVIYELSKPPVMHFAPGPPCETPFVTFKVS